MDQEPLQARDIAFIHFAAVALCGSLTVALALFLARLGVLLH
ncbi:MULTISPECIES: hypothetical protein [Pseudomonas]|nr:MULTISPECIES: hypothetical protein [Pseudomonas]SNR94371.1 hypothetical protein SAMN05216209_0329 [Pseudomonas nitroreducens]